MDIVKNGDTRICASWSLKWIEGIFHCPNDNNRKMSNRNSKKKNLKGW